MTFFDDETKGMKARIETSAGGMFIVKRLKNDGDIFHCVILEEPISWRELSTFKDDKTGEFKMQTKWACNVARFDDETLKYAEVCILETGPRHMGEVWDAVEEFGKRKVYRVKRKGRVNDKSTTWRADAIRDLTDEEVEMLKGLSKLEIRPGVQSDSFLDDFKKELAAEVKRLGWSKDDWLKASHTFYCDDRKVADLGPVQCNELLEALKQLPDGSAPDQFERTLDLDRDIEF